MGLNGEITESERKSKRLDDQTIEIPTIFNKWKHVEGISW